jgi:predicted transposase/invertase (TIGR01784 family)
MSSISSPPIRKNKMKKKSDFDKSKIKNPHDRLFKYVMDEKAVAQSFFEAYLPASLKASAKWDSLELCPNTFVDKHLQEYLTDVLYKVKRGKENIYLYILVEHQSTPQTLMPFRFLEYQVKIWGHYLKQNKKAKKLPLILPILYYSGQRSPYPYSIDLYDCFEDVELAKQYLFKPVKMVDLLQIPDEQLEHCDLSAGFQLVQKHIKDKDMGPALNRMLKKGIWAQSMKIDGNYDKVLLKYIQSEGEMQEPKAFFDNLGNAAPNEQKRKNIMTIAESLRKEGRKEGRQEGRQEGRKEEKYEVAKKLLKLKQPIEVISKVTGLKPTELKKLENSLTSKKTAQKKAS